MATLASNNTLVKLDSVDVSGYFTSVKPKFKNNTRDTTAGANITHVKRAAGLNDYSYDVSIAYDDASLQTYIQKLKPGAIVLFEWAPENNVTGKPKHIQSCIVDQNSGELKVEKDMFVWDFTLLGAVAPTFDMFTGSVY